MKKEFFNYLFLVTFSFGILSACKDHKKESDIHTYDTIQEEKYYDNNDPLNEQDPLDDTIQNQGMADTIGSGKGTTDTN